MHVSAWNPPKFCLQTRSALRTSETCPFWRFVSYVFISPVKTSILRGLTIPSAAGMAWCALSQPVSADWKRFDAAQDVVGCILEARTSLLPDVFVPFLLLLHIAQSINSWGVRMDLLIQKLSWNLTHVRLKPVWKDDVSVLQQHCLLWVPYSTGSRRALMP